MRCELAVLAVFLVPVGCASHERAPVGMFDVLDMPAPAVQAPVADHGWRNVAPGEPVPTSLLSEASQDDDPWEHRVAFFIGRREYSDGNLDQSFGGAGNFQLKETGFKGLEIDSRNTSTGHGFELGLSFGYENDSIGGGVPFDYELRTEQIYGGYRHTFRTADPENCFHPYVGLGLSIFQAHIDTPTFTPFNDESSNLTMYGRLGVNWQVSTRFHVGFDYRYLTGTDDVTFGTPSGLSTAEFDHSQYAITIGYLL